MSYSLWDWLPLEIQEHVLKFAIKESLLKPLHPEIREYYFDPLFHQDSWVLPLTKLNHRPRDTPIFQKRKDKCGCERTYRPIFNGHSKVLTKKGTYTRELCSTDEVDFCLDVT